MSYVSAELRRRVINRAGGCCEYCRTNQQDRFIPFEIDHVVAIKHGGETEPENLCLSCNRCNELKGSDIASADPETGKATFLFHPRRQQWHDHFQLDGVLIEPLTPEGRVTVFLLRLNSPARLIEREMLIRLGRYPCNS